VNEAMNLNRKQLELLSAYLDESLSERENKKAELLLASHPDAVNTLENLRNLKSLLRMLPEREVPHHFTITRQEALAARPGWLVTGLRVLSGVSAAALAAVLAIDFLLPVGSIPQPAMLESMPLEEAPATDEFALPTAIAEGDAEIEIESATEAEQSLAAPAESGEPIISNFEAAPEGLGMGGGGGSPEGDTGQPPGMILPDISISEGESLPEDRQLTEQDQLSVEKESGADAEKSIAESSPILGVAPPEEQGKVISDEVPVVPTMPEIVQQKHRFSYLVIEIILLAVSLLSILAAVFIRRKRRGLH